MIPVTRKELYLNKIVGNNDYPIPEKPITTEEFFFAEILGEAVQAPEPLTRYQMYLAKIAGRNIEIPYPEVRLEYFLARAAGMEIETPTPITREEIFWSNYTSIVEFEVENVPPLTYKAIEGTLKNYRIYGNTGGVGDKTANQWSSSLIGDTHVSPTTGLPEFYGGRCGIVTPISITGESSLFITFTSEKTGVKCMYSVISGGVLVRRQTAISSGDTINVSDGEELYVAFYRSANDLVPDDITNIMLNSGSIALPYEPYGYRVPVTVEGKNLFDNSKTANIIKCYLSISTLVSSANTRSVFIECKPNTTYTVSKIRGNRFVVGWSDELPAPGVEVQDKVINYTANSITITTGLAAKYLVAYVYSVEQDAPITAAEMIASVQIEKGSIATPYEPYHAPVTTPIYLPEQIRKVGDEAEFIDYAEQKQHVDADEEIEKQAATYMDSITPKTDVSQIVFVTMSSVPDDCTILTSGLIFTLDEADANTLNSTNYADGVRGNASTAHNYKYTWTKKYTEGETYYIRSYVKYQTADNEIKEVYGDVYKADINGFERVRKNQLDVTLPALPTLPGTNVLSVGTAVQPSKVYIKYKGERQ